MKRKLATLLWIIKLQLKTSKWTFVWKAFYAVWDGASSLVGVYFTANLISSITRVALNGDALSPVYKWLVFILVFELISQATGIIDRMVGSIFNRRIEWVMEEQMMRKMYSLSQQQFEEQEFNTKLARARDGLYQTRQLINELGWMVSSSVRFFGSIGAIIVLSPLLGILITVAAIPPALLRAKQNRLWEKAYKKAEPNDRIAFRTRWLLIEPNQMVEVRLVNGFKDLLSHWLKNRKKTDEIYLEVDKKSALLSLIENVIEPFIHFGAIIYFVKLLIKKAITLEKFLFVRGLLEQAINAAGLLANSFERLDELFIGVHNLAEIQETESAIPDGTEKVSRPLTIEFKDVSFAYPSTKQEVLKNISFLITPGSKLALVGENGAGKTTLIKLLLRQYLPTSGQILVNGVDIKNIEMGSYYAQLSNLSQNFLIVNHLTIKDNLTLGLSGDVAKEQINNAVELAGVDEFVAKLPKKLETRLDTSFDGGINLSGGQSQRLAVARAILRGGDIMILDEPTSAIDAKAEYKIFNNIYQSHAGKTTLIVSHRFSTVRKADKIIVMDGGKITEYGSHEELLSYGGLYKEMFETQAEGYR